MDRTQKEQVVENLKQVFAEAGLVVVTQQSGLNVAEATDLRRKMREAGASYKVTKNRLTRLALDGSPYVGLTELFSGPTAIAYSEDPVAAAKVVVEYSKKNDKLTVVGGAMPDKLLDQAEVKELAGLPSLDELRAKIVGMINTPATRLVGLFQASAGQLARLTAAYEGTPTGDDAETSAPAGGAADERASDVAAEAVADEAPEGAPEVADTEPGSGK